MAEHGEKGVRPYLRHRAGLIEVLSDKGSRGTRRSTIGFKHPKRSHYFVKEDAEVSYPQQTLAFIHNPK
jgi:hypothetical protein